MTPWASSEISRKTKSFAWCRVSIKSIQRSYEMNLSRARFVCVAIVRLAFALAGAVPAVAAETVEQIIAAAKKEGDEIVFVAGSQTFGGKKGLMELEAAFNKKFRLTARIHFAAGPQMSSMAARLITEAKADRKSSTDFFLGSQSHFALLH